MPGSEENKAGAVSKKKHGCRAKRRKTFNKDMGKVGVCKLCDETMEDEDVKAMECEVCNGHFCRKYINIDEAQYEVMSTFTALHWYCYECEPKITRSINVEKIIAERFMDLEAKTENKFKKTEDEVKDKASSGVVDQMFLALENINWQVLEMQRKTSEKMSDIEKQPAKLSEVVKKELTDMKKKIMISLKRKSKKLFERQEKFVMKLRRICL